VLGFPRLDCELTAGGFLQLRYSLLLGVNAVFQCTARNDIEAAVQRLKDHLEATDTSKNVQTKVISHYGNWIHDQQPPAHRCDQLNIGNHLLHQGYIGKDWIKAARPILPAQIFKRHGIPMGKGHNPFFWETAWATWQKHNEAIHKPNHKIR
jgi:hypothetical protein